MIRSYLDNDLLDGIILSFVPHILGTGLPLFRVGLPPSDWRTEESKSFSSGLIQIRWERVR